MMNLNLSFFAHKKGVGSTKNGEIPSLRDLVLRELTDSL